MTPVSDRFALPLTLLLLAAALPILAVEARPRHRDPCLSPEALRVASSIPGAVWGGERMEERSERVVQWSIGTVRTGLPEPLEFHVIRGYREPRLYMRPIALMDLRMEPERHEVLHLPVGGGTLPVHLVRDDTLHPGRFALYLFAYGTEPVEHPFVAQLGGAFDDLLHGNRLLTVWMVGGLDRRGGGPGQERGEAWIAEAWQHFESSCKAES